MVKPILFIKKDDTFLANTIRSQLEKNRYPFKDCALSVKELSGLKDNSTAMILYADDAVGENRDALVYLKDLLLEEGKELLLIGGKNELEAVLKIIPIELVEGVYERPFDMARVMEHVGELIDEEFMIQRKKMILVVDDDPTYLKVIKEWLKDDYRVSMANSGMQAITWLANNSADLVLLDYEMPTIKGSKVLEMLRSEPGTADIPVMFLTGKSDKESIMEVLALKPTGYLLKSIEKDTLLATLEKYFVQQKYKK